MRGEEVVRGRGKREIGEVDREVRGERYGRRGAKGRRRRRKEKEKKSIPQSAASSTDGGGEEYT